MFRNVFERGLASVVARWMLDGGADAVLERIARSGALKPEEIEKLRIETRAHLERVREEGAPYVDVVTAALSEVLAHVPDARDALRTAGRIAATVAAKSAEAAAIRAQGMADRWGAPAAASGPTVAPGPDPDETAFAKGPQP